jgi:2'-5' RNA ligase
MNLPEYAIVIYPKFDHKNQIDQLRNQFDPLAAVLDPHITLVFPFESDLSLEQLKAHIQYAIQGILPFEIELQGITGSEGEYLFLNVKHGNDQIIEMHDRLYTGLLEPHLIREHTYIPHLTIGRLNNKAAFLSALEITQNMKVLFTTMIKELALIRIGKNYPIVARIDLGKVS